MGSGEERVDLGLGVAVISPNVDRAAGLDDNLSGEDAEWQTQQNRQHHVARCRRRGVRCLQVSMIFSKSLIIYLVGQATRLRGDKKEVEAQSPRAGTLLTPMACFAPTALPLNLHYLLTYN